MAYLDVVDKKNIFVWLEFNLRSGRDLILLHLLGLFLGDLLGLRALESGMPRACKHEITVGWGQGGSS
jgi:hypothetical protein